MDKRKVLTYSEALYTGITRELIVAGRSSSPALLMYTRVDGPHAERAGLNMMVLGFKEVSELKDYLEDWMVDNWPEETDED